MPIIQPIAPTIPSRLAVQTDPMTQSQTNGSPIPATPTSAAYNETGEQAVQPSAPPSALQLQIQALITEQEGMVVADEAENGKTPIGSDQTS